MKTFICKITGKEYQAYFSTGFHPSVTREEIYEYETDQKLKNGELVYNQPVLPFEILRERQIAEQKAREEEKIAQYTSPVARKIYLNESLTSEDIALLLTHIRYEWTVLALEGSQTTGRLVSADIWEKGDKKRLYINLRIDSRTKRHGTIGHIDLLTGSFDTERHHYRYELANAVQALWK